MTLRKIQGSLIETGAISNTLGFTPVSDTALNTAVADLVSSAPSTLNTLNELATALGNDANFATTVTTQLGLKANASSLSNVENKSSATIRSEITSSNVTSALGYTPYNSTNPNAYISSITSGNVTTALGYTPYNSTNPSGYITGITSSNVTTALGYTPYNSTNPNGYISNVATALGYTPVSPTDLSTSVNTAVSNLVGAAPAALNTLVELSAALGNDSNYASTVTAALATKVNSSSISNVENKSSATIRSEITSGNVTAALGFTPYNSTNPSGYIASGGNYDFDIASHVNTSDYSGAAIELRELNHGGSQGAAGGFQAIAPRLGFHWGGVVASQIGMQSDGSICILNNPGNAFEKLKCGALTATNVVANGATLTNVTSSRANSTTYTNSNSRPLIVYCSFNNTNGGATLYINGSIVRYINGYGNGPGVTFIVPPGATYQVTMNSAVNQWWEY